MNAVLKTESESPSTELTVEQQAEKSLEFAKRKARLIELAAKSVSITTITNPAGRQQVHAAYMALANERIDIEKVGKEAREDAIKLQKTVIAKQKELVAITEPEETRLFNLRDAWDKAREAERAAKLEQERQRIAAIMADIATIRAATVRASTRDAGGIEEVIKEIVADDLARFAEPAYKLQAEAAKTDALAALRRMHDERVAFEAEQVRQAEERAELDRLAKIEAERMAAERAELDRRQAEQDRREREAAAKLALDEEMARLERERLAKAERDRIAAEAAEADRLRREQQEAEDRERAERQRLEDEERAELKRQEEAERAEATRKFREAQDVERKRMADEADRQRIERERLEADWLASVTLIDAATTVHEFVVGKGYGSEQCVRALGAALEREARS